MNLASTSFLLFVLAAFAVLVTTRRTALWSWALLAINGCFLASFADRPAELVPIVCFALVGYVFALSARAFHRRGVTNALAIALILLFLYLRRYNVVSFVPGIPAIYVSVGMSYMLFRMLQVLFDGTDRPGESVSPLTYSNYCFSFLTLVSGPIQRFEEFERQSVARPALDVPRLHSALSRLALGYIKVLLFADVLLRVHGKMSPAVTQALAENHNMAGALAVFCAGAVSYGLYLYCNFSGSIDVVVGIGRLCGFDLPENFNRPLQAVSFLDFWNRWHMTLSNWFKFYLFNPLLGALLRRWPAPALRHVHAVVAFFVTFFLVGAWHGTTTMFLLCGVAFGLGVSVNKLWQVRVRAWLGKKRHARLNASGLYTWASQSLTFSYYCLSIFAFWINPEQARAMFPGYGFIVANLVALVCIAAASFPVYAALALVRTTGVAAGAGAVLRRLGDSSLLVLGCKIAVALALLLGQMNDVADFVYVNF